MPRIVARVACGVALLVAFALLTQVAIAQHGPFARVHLPLVLASSGQHPPTAVPPTATLRPPTATLVPPTATQSPPTATQAPPAATSVPPTATSVPPTVIPTATACNIKTQMVQNPSFETGLAPWENDVGLVFRTTSCAVDGVYGLGFGGDNSEVEHVYQTLGTVPEWAEAGAVYFSWEMLSEDSTTRPHDGLNMQLWSRYGGVDTSILLSAVYNSDDRGTWYTRRVPIPDVPGLREHSLQIMLGAITDGIYRTWFCVDDVQLVLACGGQVP